MLNIGGTALPVKNVTGLLDDAAQSIAKQEPLPQAIARAAPDFVPLMLTAGGIAVPYAGFAVAGVVLMLKFSKPPTPEDQQRMWDQAQGVQ